MATEEEYRAEQTARQNLTDLTNQVTSSSVPIPTQDEINLTRLGLLHPDDIADPGNPEMPPLDMQQGYVQDAIDNPDQPVPPVPMPTAPVNVDVPYVSGDGTVGETLSCTTGNWDGTPTSYAFDWQSDGTGGLGTGNTYVVQDTDSGHSITCVVTASNSAGSTAAPPSNAVAVNGSARSRAKPTDEDERAPTGRHGHQGHASRRG